MIRKHFKALAEALRFERPGKFWDPNKVVQWKLDCKAIGETCKRFNSRFDYNKFIEACEKENEKGF